MTDMRLVDANALLRRIVAEENEIITDNAHAIGLHNGLTLAQAMVINAPVIDCESLRPVGEWKPYYDYFTKRKVGWICTNCSGVQNDLSNGDTDFCPHCGARMRGRSDV